MRSSRRRRAEREQRDELIDGSGEDGIITGSDQEPNSNLHVPTSLIVSLLLRGSSAKKQCVDDSMSIRHDNVRLSRRRRVRDTTPGKSTPQHAEKPASLPWPAVACRCDPSACSLSTSTEVQRATLPPLPSCAPSSLADHDHRSNSGFETAGTISVNAPALTWEHRPRGG